MEIAQHREWVDDIVDGWRAKPQELCYCTRQIQMEPDN